MKNVFLIFFALAVILTPVLLPNVAYAATSCGVWYPGSQCGIVPECFSGGPYCQACDLVRLVSNLLAFAIYFATFVATIMFTYAGFLYVTAAGSTENLTKAHDIFTKVFLGFVFVLVAWLIIDITLSVFTVKGGLGPWSTFECESVDLPAHRPGSGGGLAILDDVTLSRDEREKRDRLDLCGVGVNYPNACHPGQTTGCTTIAGLRVSTINFACKIRQECDELLERECAVIITGGSEGGHAGGGKPGSHGAGDKIDLRPTTDIREFVDENVEKKSFLKRPSPSFGSEQYDDNREEQDASQGPVWTLEGTHWDVCVNNCTRPEAQGT
jgi:ribosomal protein L33